MKSISPGVTGNLEEYGAPLSGWYCVEVIDIADETDDEDETTECELCGCQKVRYVHVMRHDDYFDDFRVGCICAGIMEGDILEAKDRERRFKNRQKRKLNFPRRKWRSSPERKLLPQLSRSGRIH
jgi:hypothetical protein